MKTITRLINVSYCVGASIVIFGCWAKIEHKSFANVFLTLGLLTEVTIFVIYAAMEWFSKPEVNVQKEERLQHFADTGELTSAVKETNSILRNVFKVN